MRYRLIILGISLFFANLLSAQEKSKLEIEKQKLIEEIEQTSAVLEQTDKKINANLENYNLLESQIHSRKKLIDNIEDELSGTTTSIVSMDKEITSLKDDIQSLKSEYQEVMQQNYIYKLSQNSFLNLFSSKSLEDAYQKWVFGRQYRQFLATKKRALESNNDQLNRVFLDLKNEQHTQEALLEDKLKETKKLNKALTKKDRLLVKLEKQQATLKVELLAKKKRQKLIAEEINRIIKAEVAKSKDAASTNKAEDLVLSGNFNSNKGKFQRPIKGGAIIGRYGKQAHPTDASLLIVNNGIDFQSGKGAQVTAIFEGVVVGDTFIPGVGNMLILRHGSYYSVYSRLDKLFVKRGDQISTGQLIGQIDEILHFEIWNGKEKEDPEPWLK